MGRAGLRLLDQGHRLSRLLPCQASRSSLVRNSGWHAFFDQIPDMAEATRRKVLDMLIADKMLVQTFHAPFPALGHMETDGQSYRFVQAPWSPAV